VSVSGPPQLVFVHRIGGLRDDASERREWLVALAGGARAAGHADAVSGLTQSWLAEVRFADYSDLFTDAEAQGDEPWTLDEQEDAAFMTEFLASTGRRARPAGRGGRR
jgi:hypothetical protein